MKTQATRANKAQIRQHIQRQRAGLPGMEFAQRHPILDAIIALLLVIIFTALYLGAPQA